MNKKKKNIVSQGFKGDTRGSPIMPRDVSLSDSKCLNWGNEWVNKTTELCKILDKYLFIEIRTILLIGGNITGGGRRQRYGGEQSHGVWTSGATGC